jgi:hypothetical protein
MATYTALAGLTANRLHGWRYDSTFEELDGLNGKRVGKATFPEDKEGALLVEAWIDMLQGENIDEIDVRNLARDGKKLREKGRVLKNIQPEELEKDIGKGGDPAQHEEAIAQDLEAWANGGRTSGKYPNALASWIMIATFRRTSKLGLEFADKVGLPVEWNLAYKNNPNALLDENLKSPSGSSHFRPISHSEVRKYARGARPKVKWMSTSTDPNTPVTEGDQKVVDEAMKEYVDARRAQRILRGEDVASDEYKEGDEHKSGEPEAESPRCWWLCGR